MAFNICEHDDCVVLYKTNDCPLCDAESVIINLEDEIETLKTE